MLKILLVLVALPAAALCVDCKKERDGHYETGCRYYVKCEKGKKTEVFCRIGEFYNAKKRKCESASKVVSPCNQRKDCLGLKDGNYADTKSKCRYYYTCAKGIYVSTNLCPANLVFNNEGQSCDYPSVTKKPCGTLTANKEDDNDHDDDDDDHRFRN